MWQFHPFPRSVHLNGLYTAFEQQLEPDYVFRGETHDFYEVVLVTDGTLGVTAGAETFVLNAPAAILHPPMEFHSLRSEQGTSPHIIIFSFAADRFPIPQNRIFTLHEQSITRARHILRFLKDSTDAVAPHAGSPLIGKEQQAQCALLELEILLLTLIANTAAEPQKEVSAGGRHYRKALQIIEENLSQPLNTAELARLAHMSPSLLKKTFAKHAGVGVMEYFRTRKINAAIPMLREDLSVQEIATRLGFSNAGYFSTVFRRVTGHAPGYYRNH
ncbi:MAG: helix-turn-helix domain-containing protein [Ruminococcaceae bacterium]|nr:helix-turn-helix domain-containing protein [Oscillospiraceae bacterium]